MPTFPTHNNTQNISFFGCSNSTAEALLKQTREIQCQLCLDGVCKVLHNQLTHYQNNFAVRRGKTLPRCLLAQFEPPSRRDRTSLPCLPSRPFRSKMGFLLMECVRLFSVCGSTASETSSHGARLRHCFLFACGPTAKDNFFFFFAMCVL